MRYDGGVESGVTFMDWETCDLSIKRIYGMNTIEFSRPYLQFLSVLKKREASSVLDLCCGYGQHSLHLDDNGFSVTAADLEPEKTERLHEICVSSNREIKVVIADMKDLPFRDRSFDAVVCLSAIHHQCTAGIQKTIAEIFRVLCPGGLLLFDILSTEDPSFGLGKEMEPNTFVGSREGEEDVPHHYATEEELIKFLKEFCRYRIERIETHLAYQGQILTDRSFSVTVQK